MPKMSYTSNSLGSDVKNNSKQYTAFITNEDYNGFNRMLFSSDNDLVVFQVVMNQVAKCMNPRETIGYI